ncbi:MAG: hypothetical protein A2Z20_05965 [Bdellovibrionales bacterium RBG_16_40_8]|nr:MAG: hypothetical protein A2Z20_05965 [Bdellovibrionales bacterium RBG_16_40_8]
MMTRCFFILCSLGVLSCGVKGDPRPPLNPPELGRGKPTFKKALQKIDFQKNKPVQKEDEEKDEKDLDSEKNGEL